MQVPPDPAPADGSGPTVSKENATVPSSTPAAQSNGPTQPAASNGDEMGKVQASTVESSKPVSGSDGKAAAGTESASVQITVAKQASDVKSAEDATNVPAQGTGSTSSTAAAKETEGPTADPAAEQGMDVDFADAKGAEKTRSSGAGSPSKDAELSAEETAELKKKKEAKLYAEEQEILDSVQILQDSKHLLGTMPPAAIPSPPSSRPHWDYVLMEMQWMATDFAGERMWKTAATRQVAHWAAAAAVKPNFLKKPTERKLQDQMDVDTAAPEKGEGTAEAGSAAERSEGAAAGGGAGVAGEGIEGKQGAGDSGKAGQGGDLDESKSEESKDDKLAGPGTPPLMEDGLPMLCYTEKPEAQEAIREHYTKMEVEESERLIAVEDQWRDWHETQMRIRRELAGAALAAAVKERVEASLAKASNVPELRSTLEPARAALPEARRPSVDLSINTNLAHPAPEPLDTPDGSLTPSGGLPGSPISKKGKRKKGKKGVIPGMPGMGVPGMEDDYGEEMTPTGADRPQTLPPGQGPPGPGARPHTPGGAVPTPTVTGKRSSHPSVVGGGMVPQKRMRTSANAAAAARAAAANAGGLSRQPSGIGAASTSSAGPGQGGNAAGKDDVGSPGLRDRSGKRLGMDRAASLDPARADKEGKAAANPGLAAANAKRAGKPGMVGPGRKAAAKGAGVKGGKAAAIAGALPWSKYEEQVLCAIVNEFQSQNWGLIADILNGSAALKGVSRRPEECKAHYKALLDRNSEGGDAASYLNIPKLQARNLLQRAGYLDEEATKVHVEMILKVMAKWKQQKKNERTDTRRVQIHPSHDHMMANCTGFKDPSEVMEIALVAGNPPPPQVATPNFPQQQPPPGHQQPQASTPSQAPGGGTGMPPPPSMPGQGIMPPPPEQMAGLPHHAPSTGQAQAAMAGHGPHAGVASPHPSIPGLRMPHHDPAHNPSAGMSAARNRMMMGGPAAMPGVPSPAGGPPMGGPRAGMPLTEQEQHQLMARLQPPGAGVPPSMPGQPQMQQMPHQQAQQQQQQNSQQMQQQQQIGQLPHQQRVPAQQQQQQQAPQAQQQPSQQQQGDQQGGPASSQGAAAGAQAAQQQQQQAAQQQQQQAQQQSQQAAQSQQAQSQAQQAQAQAAARAAAMSKAMSSQPRPPGAQAGPPMPMAMSMAVPGGNPQAAGGAMPIPMTSVPPSSAGMGGMYSMGGGVPAGAQFSHPGPPGMTPAGSGPVMGAVPQNAAMAPVGVAQSSGMMNGMPQMAVNNRSNLGPNMVMPHMPNEQPRQ